MDDGSWHYLTRSAGCRYPRRHVFIHTTHILKRSRRLYAREFATAAAIFREHHKGRNAKVARRHYDDTAALWADVAAFTRGKSRVVAWMHNVSYHARISGAMVQLPLQGWRLEAWNVAPQGTWLVWMRAKATITIVDAASVFPTSLAELSKHFRLPVDHDDEQTSTMDKAVQRCTEELQVIHDAVAAYLAWLETEELGSWQMTGTGQAFAAFRQRFLDHELLVHWDPLARDMERRAMWTGRCEAFWHGSLNGQVTDEWDMSASYPRVVADHELPVRLAKTITTNEELATWLNRPGYAVLAQVHVHTEIPVVPTMLDGRIAWPIGEFDTTLWDPELHLAFDYGDSVQMVHGLVYKTEPALQEWARWILSIVDSPEDAYPPWVRLVANHWSRATIGRFAMQHQTWEHLGQAPGRAVKWWTQKDTDTGQVSDLVQVGGQLWQSTGNIEWHNSMPAITGWVMSKVRERMTRLWLDLGDRRALYMDTDSLLVPRRFAPQVAHLVRDGEYGRLRIKRSWRRVTIHGPRQIITEDRVRVSGIPVKAVRQADGTLTGEVYESLRGAVMSGRMTRVKITPRRWRLREIDPRRLAGDDGWTQPHRLTA